MDIHLVEPPGHHREEQHHGGQQAREPEGGVRHGRGQGANIGALEDPVVEEGETEVEDEGAPDGDVVEHGPVGRVQGDLGGYHDDQDGRHHGPEQEVVRQHQSLLVGFVMVGSWTLVKI